MKNKNFFERTVTMRLPFIAFFMYVVSAILLLIVFFIFDSNDRIGTLAGGASVAAIFGLIHLIFEYYNYNNLETLNKAGLKKILTRRDDKGYYSSLIDNVNKEMKLLFETSNKFCEDFCSSSVGDDLLINKLISNKNLMVKLLIAKDNFIDEHAKQRRNMSRDCLFRMMDRFPEQFQVREYDHAPTHSIFLTEKDVVVGPYFPGLRGRNTHSLHFRSGANYVGMYEEYFNREWDNASPICRA